MDGVYMINITNLSVRYKDTLAIDNINLQINKPSITKNNISI